MFLTITHNPSGEILHQRRVSPSEPICPEHHTDRWLEKAYDGELERDISDGYIPAGCAEYRTEIHPYKHDTFHIWAALDWFGRPV